MPEDVAEPLKGSVAFGETLQICTLVIFTVVFVASLANLAETEQADSGWEKVKGTGPLLAGRDSVFVAKMTSACLSPLAG